MGMNMISRFTDRALNELCKLFPGMQVVSLSSNYCTDKKNSALNWVLGRGRRGHMYAASPVNMYGKYSMLNQKMSSKHTSLRI